MSNSLDNDARAAALAAGAGAILRLIQLGHQRNAVLQQEVGLTVGQARLLELLVAAGGGQSQQALVGQTRESGPTITGLINRLVEAGLVERQGQATNRRVMQITLTAAGQDGYARYAAWQAARLGEATASLSDTELATFTRLLSRFVGALEDRS
jgi:DNA-binding MarR family transcriptional regulator